ncbi:MAG: hypothetical protein ACM362_08210, partial [Candidatus Methylomirabilota bacterium]
MRRLVLTTMVLALLAIATVAPVARAAAPAPGPANEECLGCHADKGLRGGVDEAVLKASVHGNLACTACHQGIAEVPHAEKLPRVACQQCHTKATGVFVSSIHGRNKGTPRVACQSCHGTHTVAPAAKLGAEPCQACHAPVTKAYLGSVHARALARGVQDASLCFDCHGEAHRLRSHTDPESPTTRVRTAETCGRCHADRALVERRHIPIPQAYQLYQKSVHGRAVAAGKQAATCNDCHESHDLRRANDPKSAIYRENIPKTCGKCHAAETRTFLESVHGTAMAQGVTKSPVCTDCHGEHSIRAARDPASRVSVASVSRT